MNTKTKNKSIISKVLFAVTLLAVLGMTVAPAAAQLADTPWPKFHGDNRNTGLSPYTGPNTNAVKWTYTTGSDIRSSPVIDADGTIYIGSSDREFRAIYPNGTLKWSYLTGDLVYNSAIAADGTIYVGSNDYNLYAIYPNGTLKWSYLIGNKIYYSSPAIDADGTIYVGSNDFKLHAINPDGTLKWSYLTGNKIYSSPAIGADGTIYIGSNDYNLYAINPDGTLKWSYLTGNIVYSSPAIDADGTIYVGSNDDNLYAINPDGTLKWSYLTGGDVRSSPAIGADSTIYVGSYDDKLHAIYPDGTLKWSYLTGGNIAFSSPVIDAAGTIYVGSYDEKLHAIYPDGTLKWSYLTGDNILSTSPAIGVDGTIYVGSTDKKLYAFGPGPADLTPTAITTPASIIATQSNIIEATIANIGAGNASSFNVSLSADGTPVDTASVDSLSAGTSTDVSFSWTPASAGGYELCVVADSDGAVDESDETNNGLCKGVTVEAAGPTNKVYFEPATISASYCEERTVSVWANTSAATTGGKIVLNYTCCCANITGWVRNTTNFATGAADIYCGYASLTFASTDVRGPGLVHIGDLTIHCCNDTSDCMTDLAFVTGESELIEGPPDFAKITPVEWVDGSINCMAPAAQPDLNVTEKYETLANGNFTVTYTVKNIGDAEAGASNTSIYVDGTAVGEDPVPALAAGANYTNTAGPFDCPCGTTVTVKVCADNENVVSESDETNNCMENELVCSPCPKPDLNVTEKYETLDDGNFTVTYTVANVGGADAGASNTSIYVDGTAVCEDPVPGLAAGANYTNTVGSFDCPCGTTVTVKVCADNENVVDESDETNNCMENELECSPCPTPEYTIKIDDYTINLFDGGEVTVPVEILNATDVEGGEANVTFNASVVNVKAVSAGNFPTLVPYIDNTNGFVHIAASSATAAGVDEAVLAYVVFEGLAEGETNLMIDDAYVSFDAGAISIPAATDDGHITVETWMRGDLNHNDRLDTGDATLVLRMVVGLTPVDMLGDMNDNGRIDTGDATIILRIIVGLPV